MVRNTMKKITGSLIPEEIESDNGFRLLSIDYESGEFYGEISKDTIKKIKNHEHIKIY